MSKEVELPELDITAEDKRAAMGYVMDEMSTRTSWTALRDIAEEERSKSIALSRQIAALTAQVEELEDARDTCKEAYELMQVRCKKAEAELATVLDRESATTARYDARIDKLEAELAALRAGAKVAYRYDVSADGKNWEALISIAPEKQTKESVAAWLANSCFRHSRRIEVIERILGEKGEG
jgi:chromosome segregation ATPase